MRVPVYAWFTFLRPFGYLVPVPEITRFMSLCLPDSCTNVLVVTQ